MTEPESNGLTRLTVNLIPRAVDALAELAVTTGLSKTDVINRAVQLYRVVDEWTREPGGLRIVRTDGQVERVHVV